MPPHWKSSDQYTREATPDRVSQYAVSIARQLGLASGGDPRRSGIGGHLHDIGKIGVRESVLNKPGPLTDDEYAHIMTHPMVGWRILSPILGDAPLALNIVRSHHERFDGRGVPDRITGLEIPLEARIVSVADSYDAMTSGRAYRRGGKMSLEAAQAEFRRCSGTQFDPAIVDAFAAAAAAGEIQLPTTMPISGEMAAIGSSAPLPPERATVPAQVLRAG